MKPLSRQEKLNHHKSLEVFVKIVNECVIPCKISNRHLSLAEVGYGVPLDNEYFYFDYPYNATVDKFNDDLANAPYLKNVDIYIHNKYYELQTAGSLGYLYYEYGTDKGGYYLIKKDTNLHLNPEDPNFFKFLPIMHCAITNETSYMEEVMEVDEWDGARRQILILSKRLGIDTETKHYDEPVSDDIAVIRNNILVCTFEIHDYKGLPATSLIYELCTHIVDLFENYFNNSVLSKLLRERKSSEVLTYEHSLGNLGIQAGIERIRLTAAHLGLHELLSVADKLKMRAEVANISLYSLFYSFKGMEPKENFRFYDKTVPEIISFYIDKLNYNQYKVFFKQPEDVLLLFKKISVSDLFDTQIVLWNLWTNAGSSSPQGSEIFICLAEYEGRPMIVVKNEGRIPERFFNYISGRTSAYPKRNNYNDSKAFRGLEIIREKVEEHNWIIAARVYEESDGKSYTEISLTF